MKELMKKEDQRINMNYYNEIKEQLINNAINKTIKNYSINRSDINSYYNVGKILSEAGKHYGEEIIKEYSQKLKCDLNKNYSVRLLYRMLKYYNFVFEKKLPTLSAKLSWSHYDEILKFDDINEITFYIKVTELKKEHTGQIMTYMNYIDKNIKTIEENDTVGIIICKQDNEYVIKYCSDDRIIAREYEII